MALRQVGAMAGAEGSREVFGKELRSQSSGSKPCLRADSMQGHDRRRTAGEKLFSKLGSEGGYQLEMLEKHAFTWHSHKVTASQNHDAMCKTVRWAKQSKWITLRLEGLSERKLKELAWSGQ